MAEPQVTPEVPLAEDDALSLEPPTKKAKYAENPEDEAKNLWNSPCEECKTTKGKYRCPGCNVITCSLPCTKAHRSRTGCKGQRNRTAFVALSQFNEDHLLNDIDLLNDFVRVADSSKRRQTEEFKETLPKRLKILTSKTKQLGLKLHFLPSIMTKHQINTTRYDVKQQRLLWHVELVFDLIEDKERRIIDLPGLDDSMTAEAAILQMLANPKNSSIKEMFEKFYPSDPSEWRFYLQQSMCPANHPLYHALQSPNTVRQTLLLSDILEFPTIVISTKDMEEKFELFTEERYKLRFQAHIDQIEQMAASEPESSESGSSDDSDDDDDSSDSSSDSNSSSDSDSSASDSGSKLGNPAQPLGTLS